MLKVFRNNVKRLAWTLWLVIAAFLFFYVADYVNPGPSASDAAAIVGDEVVTFPELEQAYKRLEQQYSSQFGSNFTPELARQLGLPQQAVNSLIARKILLREAKKLGLEPTDQELRDEILSIPVFQGPGGGFIGDQEYVRILRQNGMTPETFEEDLRHDLSHTRLLQVLADTTYVADAEVEKIAREEAERVSFRYVQLAAGQIDDEVTVDDAALGSYFEAHRTDFRIPERRRAGYLSVNQNIVRAELEITDDEVRRYYDEHADEFSREEQVRARHILLFVSPERSAEQAAAELEALKGRIEAGEDFASLARELSEDEGSKANGGDLGYFGRGQMTPAFEEAAFGAEPGSLVGPFENALGPRTGYHLVEVLDHRPGGLEPFESAQNGIRVRLLNERAREVTETRAQELFARVSETTLASSDELSTLATSEGVTSELLEPFSREDTVPSIGRGTPFVDAVFSLEPGKIGEPVRIPAGWALPVVFAIEPPRVPELTEIREEVREKAAVAERQKLAAAKLATLKKEVKDGSSSFDEAIARLELTAQETGPVGANDAIGSLGAQPQLVNAALALEPGELGGPISTDRGEVLFEVVDREHFDAEAFEASKEDRRRELAAQRVQSLLQSLIERRRLELGVTYTESFIERFEIAASS